MNRLQTPLVILTLVIGSAHAQGAPLTDNQAINSVAPVVFMAQPLTTEAPQSLSRLDTAPFPVSGQGTYQNSYDWGNCTAYVASRIRVPDSWGNANTWAQRAEAEGIVVSNVPIVGAIAQSSAGYYGHVAVVTAIGDGTVTVDEMNVYGLGSVDTQTYPASRFVYIYL